MKIIKVDHGDGLVVYYGPFNDGEAERIAADLPSGYDVTVLFINSAYQIGELQDAGK